MKNIIKSILHSWSERELPEVIDRETNLTGYTQTKVKKITVVTGFRRTGKTYLLFHLLKKLLKKEGKQKNVYINFEDERIPLKTEFLTKLLPTIKETYGDQIDCLLLDEIHNIPGWSKWLRRIHDTEDIKIFVTGSSSKMSSREIPTELRGRFLEVRLYPLNFREYLKFKNHDLNVESIQHSENKKAKTLNLLNEYIRYGGLPEVVLSSPDKKTEILKGYYNTVVRRDIIERFNVRNQEGLKALLLLLLNSTYYSISKMHNNLKSMNYAIGKATIQRYMNHIQDSYLTESLPLFSYKIKDQMQHPRKNYFTDTGLVNTLSTRFSENTGRLYENLVFLELKRRGSKTPDQEIYYWRSPRKTHEVDFVVKDGLKAKQLIQVCSSLGDIDTRKRETTALVKASSELNCRNLLIITEDEEGEDSIKGRKITYTPLWKWLLE